MAQSQEEKDAAAEQKALFGELEKNDVTVAEDKAEAMKENIMKDRGGANYLGIGVHDVEVTSVELAKANTGTLGIRFNVENGDGRSDVTMWLSEAALPYTIENVSRLMVHNALTDEKKEKARVHMSNITSAKELFELVQQTMEVRVKEKLPFVGVLVISEDKSGRTYTDKNGDEKPSLVRNLQTWKPKQTPEQSAAQAVGGTVAKGEEKEDLLNGLPF